MLHQTGRNVHIRLSTAKLPQFPSLKYEELAFLLLLFQIRPTVLCFFPGASRKQKKSINLSTTSSSKDVLCVPFSHFHSSSLATQSPAEKIGMSHFLCKWFQIKIEMKKISLKTKKKLIQILCKKHIYDPEPFRGKHYRYSLKITFGCRLSSTSLSFFILQLGFCFLFFFQVIHSIDLSFCDEWGS